jgi:alpha-L-glutamate ligase-like protein
MPISKDALGMNARNFLYIRKYNPASAKRIADDKLETKKILLEHDIKTADLLASFYTRDDIRNFDWSLLPANGFTIKPARGYGGEGIMVIRSWEKDKGKKITGEEVSVRELESHLLDILEGAYSLQNLPDKAFIEERIRISPFFKKLTSLGIPDIRFIVFNKVPVMAMTRIPTEESQGKANLHQGAIGIGIDMRTGITTYAVYKDRPIGHIPGTKTKTRGIKIPQWNELLLLASRVQDASGLGYVGVDIVFDLHKGPLLLETNARPGLAVQIANRASQRERLERVEHMHIPDCERGVEVAKSLFAEAFSAKVQVTPKVLGVIEPVTLKNGDQEISVEAKLDTGAYRTSIDEKLVKDLDLKESTQKVAVMSAHGGSTRPLVNLTFELAGKKITTVASFTDRSRLRYPMIVGRKDLKGFLVNPEQAPDEEDESEKKNEE